MDNYVSSTIVVATYNRASYLTATLSSLSRVIQGLGKLEVIIINNNSTDATEVVALNHQDRLGSFKLVKEMNQGLSFARNRGVNEATGDVVVFLDDDVELDPEWLHELLAPFADPTVAVTGGKVLPYGMQAFPDWLPREYGYLASVFDPSDAVCDLEKVMGANFAVRRKVFDQVGLFDVTLGRKGTKLLGGEEVELFRRVRDAGHRIVYTPRSVVWHKIAEKLKPEYIENYAYWLGVSEAVIEKRLAYRSKYLLKLLRSWLWPGTIYRVKKGLTRSDPASSMRYVIRRNYARGYVEHRKALAETV